MDCVKLYTSAMYKHLVLLGQYGARFSDHDQFIENRLFPNVFKNMSASVEAISFECGRIISGTTTDTICMEQTVEKSQADNMFYVNTKTSQQGQLQNW